MRFHLVAVSCACIGLMAVSGCGGSSAEMPSAAPELTVAVTAAMAETRPVRVAQRTLGRLEAKALPTVAAETSGRVKRTLVEEGEFVSSGTLLAELDDERQRLALASAEATIRRVEALLENQGRVVSRLRRLAAEQSVSESVLEEAEAQERALAAQLSEAEAARNEASRDLAKTRVLSPVDGVIQRRHVSEGDYVAVGEPMFEIVQQDRLRAYLPFPEVIARDIRPGMKVNLRSVAGSEQTVESAVKEVRPVIGRSSRAVEAIVEFENPDGWRAGGTVVGEVVVEERPASVVVPEASVVLRPEGAVVYRIESGRAVEVPVKTGVAKDGWVEIREGLSGGEAVAEDGAGFLTGGVAVDVRSRAA